MAKALTDSDILEHPIVRDNPVKVVQYPDIMNMTNIEQLFGTHTAVIVLYNVISRGNGHWVLLIKHKKDCAPCTYYGSNRDSRGRRCDPGVIEFFDPYGNGIDFVLSIQDPSKRARLGQTSAKLSHLLGMSQYCVVYNDQRLQVASPKIQTCGHHCLARLSLRHLEVDDYAKYISRLGCCPDDTVVNIYRKYR